MVVNVEMVAKYYEVTPKAINTVVDRHRTELEEDGIMVLKGTEAKEFKTKIWYPQSEETKKYEVVTDYSKLNKTTVTTILTRRAMLRIGMLLTTSDVAVKVRNYLLNLEENSTLEQKKWAIQREVGKIDRKRMTTAIKDYVPESPKKGFMYPTYTNLVYRILFGKDAKTIRGEKGLTKNSELTRDHFNEEELRLIDECETIITALLTLGFNYNYIKEQLENKYKDTKLLS